MAVFGILKRFDLNFFGLWEYPDVSQSVFHNSLTGPYVNRNHMAGFLELVIFPVISLFLLKGRSREEKLGISLLLLLFLAALVLTLSRGGWISTACGLLFLVGVQVSRKGVKKSSLLAGAVLAVFIGVVILVNTPVVQRITTLTEGSAIDSMAGRTRTWKGTWNMVKDYPLTGTGPGTFSHVYPRYQLPGSPYLERYAHNDYLQFVSEAGIGFVPVVIWLIYLFYRAGFEKLKSRSRQTRGLTLGAMSGCTAILVHSVSDFNLQIPGNALIFTVWAAFVMRPGRHGAGGSDEKNKIDNVPTEE